MSIFKEEIILHKPKSSYHYHLDKLKDLKPGYKYFVYDGKGLSLKRLRHHKSRKIYKVTLINNTEIYVTKDNLNYIKNRPEDEIKLKTTLTLLNSKHNAYLPFALNEIEGIGGKKELANYFGVFYKYGMVDRFYASLLALPSTEFGETLLKGAKEQLKEFCFPVLTVSRNEPYKENNLVLRAVDKSVLHFCYNNFDVSNSYNLIKGRLLSFNKDFKKEFLKSFKSSNKQPGVSFTNKAQLQNFIGFISTMGLYPHVTNVDGEYVIKKLNRLEDINNWLPDDDSLFYEDNYLWIKVKSIKEHSRDITYTLESEDNKPNIFHLFNSGVIIHSKEL